MGEKEPYDRVHPILPGDKVLRLRRRKPRARLRVVPNIPALFRFFGDLVTQTPLIPILLVLIGLLLVFSAAIYAVERGGNQSIESFGAAVWWSISAMQTMGFNAPGPLTSAGRVIGSIWAVLGTILFFGAIIASITAYFMYHRRRPTREIAATIQYNMERLDDLTLEELELLKEAAVRLIDAQMERVKKES